MTLMILSLCSVLFASIARIMVHVDIRDERSSDEIALMQMQLILAQSTNLQVLPKQLTMHYHGESIEILPYEDKLVKRPGFEVLLQRVDDIQFWMSETCVYVTWKRGVQHEEAMLTCT